MTVCVAVINHGAVIGACDRMITSGDIEFEPDVLWKATPLTSAICVMWGGQAAYQAEVIQAVQVELAQTDPANCTVRRATETYIAQWRAAKRRRAESVVLGSIGLTLGDLINGLHGLSEETVQQLLAMVIQWELPSDREGVTEAIVTGIDSDFSNGLPGAHIYKLWNDQYWCEDSTCFAAIGSGAWHANSQLMHARYHSGISQEAALWQTFVAKKRAEVAPGVGAAGTNVFFLGPQPGTSITVSSLWIERLEKEYRRVQAQERRLAEAPVKRIRQWLDENITKTKTTTPPPEPPPAPPPPESESPPQPTDGPPTPPPSPE
jgi:hypothetical protein